MARPAVALHALVTLALLATAFSSFVGAGFSGPGGWYLDVSAGKILERHTFPVPVEEHLPALGLDVASPLRLAGGGKHAVDLAFAGHVPRTFGRPVREARHAGLVMSKDEMGKKYTIFNGKFSSKALPKNIFNSLSGISLFSSNVRPSWAHSGNGFPLLMADANNKVPPRSDGRKRVLIVLSDTGGGHKASAKAIQAALDQLYPNKFFVEITDIWTDYGNWPFTTFVESYQWLAKNMWAWRIAYNYAELLPSRVATEVLSDLACYNSFRAYIESFRPDIVVSVHPLCQTIPLKVLKNMGGGKRQIPFVTVVTDLGGASSLWFNKEVDRCCVPGDAVEKLAYRCGLTRDQVRKHGLPVRQGFWGATGRKAESKKLKAQLKLEDVPTVLVVGGGDGVGGLQKVAQNVGIKLGKFKERCQMVVICGKNEAVQKKLSNAAWPSNVVVHVQGFVSNMDDWMVASDCLVTKAGPGTIAEASILGLPTMLSSFLPGQEAGNVPYVIEAGFGDYEADAGKLGYKVAQWLADKKKLATMSQAASLVGKHHSAATKEIARDIADLCFSNYPLGSAVKA